MILFLITEAMWAGDEDINPNIYQQFDPVTGFLVDVDPQNAGQHPKNAGQQIVASSQEKNVSTSAPDLASSEATENNSGLELASSEAAENNFGFSLYLMIGSMAVISFLAVIFFLKRRQMHQ
jgi:hypothetical protein